MSRTRRVRQRALTPNESYMHLAAKHVVVEWLRQNADHPQGPYVYLDPVSCKVNRGAPSFGVWLEYPIGDAGEGVQAVWDEHDFWWNQEESVPTVAHLNQQGIRVACVCDVGICHKGMLSAAVEVVHSHPTPDWKRAFLDRHGVDLYEVDASAVLRHTKRPERLPLWKPRGLHAANAVLGAKP